MIAPPCAKALLSQIRVHTRAGVPAALPAQRPKQRREQQLVEDHSLNTSRRIQGDHQRPPARLAAVLQACAATALWKRDRCAAQLAHELERSPELDMLAVEFARLLASTGEFALAIERIESERARSHAAAQPRRLRADVAVRGIEDDLHTSEQ